MSLFGAPVPPVPRAINCMRCRVNTSVAHCEMKCGWFDCDLCLHRTSIKLKGNKWVVRSVLKPQPQEV